jgi:hypothetical protein
MDKLQYAKDKILGRLQARLSFQEIQKVKQFLLLFKNLDLVNKPGATFESSVVGWLTASKIIQQTIESGQDLVLSNFAQEYMLTNHSLGSQNISRKEDIIDENFNEEDVSIKVARILSEYGEMDITESFDVDSLTYEGLRSRNLVDKNFTSLDGVEAELVSFKSLPTVEVAFGETILSPYTGTAEIYQLDSETFLDIDADKEFKVKYI